MSSHKKPNLPVSEDAVLRRMLSTPPEPHKPKTAKRKPKSKPKPKQPKKKPA